jgi:DNA-binding CsgD family transcriptional regulator
MDASHSVGEMLKGFCEKGLTRKQSLFAKHLISHKSISKKLTKSEISCLFWTSQGKTAEEIARTLGLTKQTVYSYYKSIRQKLPCKTMAHAVFISAFLG